MRILSAVCHIESNIILSICNTDCLKIQNLEVALRQGPREAKVMESPLHLRSLIKNAFCFWTIQMQIGRHLNSQILMFKKQETNGTVEVDPVNPRTGFPERKYSSSIYDIDYSWFKPKSADIFGRVKPAAEWIREQQKHGMWLYNRVMLTGPSTEVLGLDDTNNVIYGINFASADYLGLAQNPFGKEAAIQAIKDFGCNSAGSPVAFGATKYYMQLRKELADYWQLSNVMIYSAGWLAGFGVVKGLIKEWDFVIMDRLSHNCLQEGANAATRNVIKFAHLDTDEMEEKLKKTREENPEAGIMVITEGLFSMDSDTPDLNRFQQVTKKYNAVMLLDCAHDFGCMGDNGRGTWELQGLKDRSNVIFMGTGSKCLSTNIGFVGCDDPNVVEYLKIFSSAYMFTNAINPMQAATSLANLRILKSEHGRQRRKQVMANYHYMREKLDAKGHTIYGNPCPILPLKVGNEIVCRLVSRTMMDEGIHVNGIEFPVVTLGEARLRVNLMPQHSKEHMDVFLNTFEKCLAESTKIFEKNQKEFEKKHKELAAKL